MKRLLDLRLLTLSYCLFFGMTGCTNAKDKAVSSGEGQTSRPNIVLILADDLGYADVGFNGSTDIITPTLDSLAANGTIFSDAYTAHPFCGPSRAGLLTGRYPHKIGSQFNLPDIDMSGGLGIPASETYFSETLQDAGYYTGVIGKWHLGETPQYHPNVRGFDEFYGFLGGGHDYFPEKFHAKYDNLIKQGIEYNIPHYSKPLEHNGVEVRETEYITDALSREAAKFIKSADTLGKPFFLYLSYNAPHTPIEAKEEDMAKFPHIKDKLRRTYAGMVYAMDRGINTVVESLKETGQLDNTLIVFFSDNGGKLIAGANNTPLTEGKGSVYEGGHRTPMLFHWPKNVPAGKVFKHPILALDFYPTFAGLAGAAIPAEKALDGKDIWNDFIAGTSPHKGETFYSLRHRGDSSDAAARRDNWKIVRVNNEPWKLFDMSNDIAEKYDLSAKYPALVRDMIAGMNQWSWTNTQPLWFHIQDEGVLWRENGMPRFHETFNAEQFLTQ